MKCKWIKATRTLRLWLQPGHIISLIFWMRGWWSCFKSTRHYGLIYWFQQLVGYEYVEWEDGDQRDFWLGPFRLEWWTHTGSEDGQHYWEEIWVKK